MQPSFLVAKRFQLKDLAGQGGMGEVWRASDQQTGKDVAVKFLTAEDKRLIDRFLIEAKILSELIHPGIVRYIEHGQIPDGELFLVMEWLEGEDLAQRLERGKLSEEETLRLLSRVTEALAFAHQKGVIHRDIKPSNIFLQRGDLNAPKLLDFGVARDKGSQLTRTGSVMGTPAYMSPEQARGIKEIDGRADIFSLGCVFYECITGQAPFNGQDYLAIFAKLLFQEPLKVHELRPECSSAIEAQIHRMLTKEPSGRPDANMLRRELLSLQGESTSQIAIEPASLTKGERRLFSVVFCGQIKEEWGALSGLSQEAANSFGAIQERLSDGSTIYLLEGEAAIDRALRAARLALALRYKLPMVPLAVVTGRGERVPLLLGEVMERGASLLRIAERKENTSAGSPIRVDTLTAGLLDVRFDIGGDTEGLYLWREREVDAGARSWGRTSFVGREAELAMMRAIFTECCTSRAACALLVTAPVGVGKSRLRQEFLRPMIQEQHAEVWSSWGDPMRTGAPYSLLAQAIRRACSIQDDEPLAVRQQKLKARISRYWSSPSEDAEKTLTEDSDHRQTLQEGAQSTLKHAKDDGLRLLEFLSELIDAPFAKRGKIEASVQLQAARRDPFLMGDQLRRAWEDFIAVECAERPVILVLEDLHWGDLPSIQLIEGALRRLERAPFFVLAFARPEVYQLFPDIWTTRDRRDLRLDVLNRRSSERLLRQLSGDALNERESKDLLDKAAGNAFYLEELCQAALSDPSNTLPETLLATAQARLEALSELERQVLRACSLFGQVSSRVGLLKLVGREARASLGETLTLLEQREILLRRGAGANAEYVFRHDLFREAAYLSLTGEDQVIGHRLAGEFLEERGGVEAVVLAEHFARGDCDERACEWYVAAAQEALAGSDLTATLARVNRALSLGAKGLVRGKLLSFAVEVHRLQGQHKEVETLGQEALSYVTPDSRGWYNILGHVAMASARIGNQERFRTLVELLRGALITQAAQDEEAKAAKLIALSRVIFQMINLGQHESASQLLEELSRVEAPWDCKDPHILAQLYQAYALPELFVGNAERGLAYISTAVSSFERAGDLRNACTERLDVALGYLRLGVYEEAEKSLRIALEGAASMGLHRVTVVAKSMLGLVLLCLERVEEAYQSESEAIIALSNQKDQLIEGVSRAHMVKILIRRADLIGAEREALLARSLLANFPAVRCYGLARRAEVRLALGFAQDAVELSAEAIRKIAPMHWGGHGAELARLIHAEALYRSGDALSAKRAILDAKQILQEQASAITASHLRQSFLTRVPENHRVFTLAQAWV
jgi:tetratricopeptide (TPR) repeat protein